MRTPITGSPHKPSEAGCVGRGGAAERVSFRAYTETNDTKLVTTMGSLFDGIGGFPLAAVHNGIIPVWASEIEAYPWLEPEPDLPVNAPAFLWNRSDS